MKFSYPNFLVVGLERSGTHWISAILNAHPDIACFPSLPWRPEDGGNKIGEMHFFNTIASLDERTAGDFARPIEDFLTKYNKVFADLVPKKEEMPLEQFYCLLLERYCDYCNSQRSTKKLVGESTPAYVFYMDFIDRFYPNMKKICIIRDSKDKLVSWHFNLVRKGKASGRKITLSFAEAYMRERVIPELSSLLSYEGSLHCLTYESLSHDPFPTVSSVLSYLGANITSSDIEHMVEEGNFERRAVLDGSGGRQRGEEDVTSSYRKGIVGDWKNVLESKVAKHVDDLTTDLRTRVYNKYNLAI